MFSVIFWVIISIIVVDFLFEKYLDYLNTTRWSNTIPVELKGIYDEEKYLKQQSYERENHRFSFITEGFSFVITLAMFLFAGFALVDSWAWQITSNAILSALVFFGIILFLSDILGIPFELYSIFHIEQKYGFNKTTPGIYMADKLKGWILSAILGGGILAFIVFLYLKTGEMFWIYAWITVSGFSVFMAMFYSNLIVPLFNKQTPLPEGELRDAINSFAQKVGFRLDNIYVIDGSKRSTKANAYFTGLGPKKRIVLYDTLIEDLATDELVAVLAHEIGHYKKKHIIQSLVISVVQTGLMLFIFSLFVSNPALSKALGVEKPDFQIGAIAFGILYSPFSFVTGIFMNMLSRKNEYEADYFAARNFSPDALSNALKKLSVKNLSNLTPHPWYVFFNYSHPTLLQRLEKINANKKFSE